MQEIDQVSLKMDVSCSSQFDIMRPDGVKIYSVMGCNIHFPEHNHTEQISNTVTVIGDQNGVEKVRAHIRVCKFGTLKKN